MGARTQEKSLVALEKTSEVLKVLEVRLEGKSDEVSFHLSWPLPLCA